jgi:sulfonate transport system substrate-binding protein
VEIAAKMTKTPPTLWQGWVFTKKDDYRSPDMLPDLRALQANIETQREMGFLTKDIKIAKYADLSIVKEAAARLKQ